LRGANQWVVCKTLQLWEKPRAVEVSVPAFEVVIQLHDLSSRRPRESGGPGQAYEIPRSRFRRERRNKTAPGTNSNFLIASFAGKTTTLGLLSSLPTDLRVRRAATKYWRCLSSFCVSWTDPPAGACLDYGLTIKR